MNLRQHYSMRKYKEIITLNCLDKCLKSFREDDLTRNELNCLNNCYHKYYRHLAYSNTVYQVLTSGDEIKDLLAREEEDALMQQSMADKIA